MKRIFLHKYKTGCIILAALFLCFWLVSVVVKAEDQSEYYDTTPFSGKKIGVQTGTTLVDLTAELIDDPQLVYFTSAPDIVTALKSGKIDAAVHDEPVMRYLASQVGGIQVEKLGGFTDYLAQAFPKTEQGEQLRDKMSVFIQGLRESGKLDELEEKWFNGSSEEQVMDDYEDYPDTNGVLVIATDPGYAPFEFLADGKYVGYEMEIVADFCKEYGYRPEIVACDFSGVIAGISSGKFDMGASGLTITEERKESVYFGEPFYESVYAIAFPEEENTQSSIIESFKKTFITENRWKDFLSGALVTIEITIISILIGTVLGFVWYLLYRRNKKVITAVSNAVLWVIDGMPIVVFLMILFYIIFGNSNFSANTIAIVGFSIIFSCFMLSTMKIGEKAIEPGQYLAAEALGYKNTRAFFRIIFPQAARHIWPVYISQISAHIKATAVVGYITVVDITKVGDLIRGRTYEAFFPLISVAIAYFIMTAILQRIARIVEKKTDPFRRSEEQILKGAVIK